MYKEIIKFIPLLEDPNTKWEEEQDNFFYYNYSEPAIMLMDAITDKMLGASNTYHILDKYNIECDFIYDDIDIESFNLELSYAILAVIVRKERFCSGAFMKAIKLGLVLKLIKNIEKYSKKS